MPAFGSRAGDAFKAYKVTKLAGKVGKVGDVAEIGGKAITGDVKFLYAVAEAFLWLSGRELDNVLEDFLNARRSMDSVICTIVLVLITFVPSWFFYQLFVVDEMCRA